MNSTDHDDTIPWREAVINEHGYCAECGEYINEEQSHRLSCSSHPRRKCTCEADPGKECFQHPTPFDTKVAIAGQKLADVAAKARPGDLQRKLEENARAKDPDALAQDRLDALFTAAFDTNHPAMLDWVRIRMRLQRLERELEALRVKVPEVEIDDGWISTSKALPDQGHDVEVLFTWGSSGIARRDWQQGGKPEHWRDGHNSRIECENVSHWRPRTPAPRGKKAL